MLTLGRLASGAVILAIAILMSWLMMWGKGPVTNWTLKGDTRRIPIPFAVAYGADHGGVRDAVLAADRDFPFTLLETEGRTSQIWMVGFGDSSRFGASVRIAARQDDMSAGAGEFARGFKSQPGGAGDQGGLASLRWDVGGGPTGHSGLRNTDRWRGRKRGGA